MQPPLQLTIAPQLMLAFASSLQLPLHVPLQEPSQWPGVPGVIMHSASHLPLQVPAHIPVLGMPVPPEAVHVPMQLPMHVPLHVIEPAVGGVQRPGAVGFARALALRLDAHGAFARRARVARRVALAPRARPGRTRP